MTRHFDEQTVAAFREGLLGRHKRARVAAHLAACSHCAHLDSQLAAVSVLLAAAPPPELPPTLAERLEAALAAEAGRGAFGASASAPSGPDRVRDLPAAPRRRGHARRGQGRRAGSGLVLRIATATAAVVVLAGGGYVLSQSVSFSSGSSATSAGSGSVNRGAPAASPGPASGTRRITGASKVTPLPLISSGTDYQRHTLAEQATAVLGRYRPAASKSPSPTADLQAPWSSAAAISGCVSRVTGGIEPLLVDLARYGGRPAAVIVAQTGLGRVVWVVGTGCSAHDGDVLASVVLTRPG